MRIKYILTPTCIDLHQFSLPEISNIASLLVLGQNTPLYMYYPGKMMRQLPKLLEKLQTHLNYEHLSILSRQPGDLRSSLALWDCEAFKHSTLSRLTWVGGTGEGWWEVDDFSRAFRRLSNLKMAIWRSATTVRRGGEGERTLSCRPCISSQVRTNVLLLKVSFKTTSCPSQREACKVLIKTLACARLATDKVCKGYTPQKQDPIQFCFHATRSSYLPLRRFWFSTSRWEILERSSFWSPAGPEEVVLALCNKENRDESNLST